MNKVMNLLIILLIFTITAVKGIRKLSDCKAELDDGSVIDLSSLDNPNNPRQYVDVRKGDIYKYNPCSPISCRIGAKTAVICQTNLNINYVLGQQKYVNFDIDPDSSMVMVFTGGDDGRRVLIKCKCDQSEMFRFWDSDDGLYVYYKIPHYILQ
jgi:hypothetical protein